MCIYIYIHCIYIYIIVYLYCIYIYMHIYPHRIPLYPHSNPSFCFTLEKLLGLEETTAWEKALTIRLQWMVFTDWIRGTNCGEGSPNMDGLLLKIGTWLDAKCCKCLFPIWFWMVYHWVLGFTTEHSHITFTNWNLACWQRQLRVVLNTSFNILYVQQQNWNPRTFTIKYAHVFWPFWALTAGASHFFWNLQGYPTARGRDDRLPTGVDDRGDGKIDDGNHIWLVVWNMFFFPIYWFPVASCKRSHNEAAWWWLEPWNLIRLSRNSWECHHPNWRSKSYFSEG